MRNTKEEKIQSNRLKILLLTDGQGWIVDRISKTMKELIPHDIMIDNYRTYDPKKLLDADYDVIHFNNWDVGRFKDVIPLITTPMIMSVRSFRYSDDAVEMAKHMNRVHVIHPDLKKNFENSVYISDGIFEGFEPKPFVVGMAIQNTQWSKEYKGYYLVESACKALGCEFKPALDVPPEKMREYYESIDLLVCASIQEGFGASVMECLLMNKPILTTDVGIPKYLNVNKCERSIEDIIRGISMFYTYPQVKDFTWQTICGAISLMYEDVVNEIRHTIPVETIDFIKCHRSEIKGDVVAGYIKSVVQDFNEIVKHIPEIKSVLDIGAGLGLIDKLFGERYGCELYLLDSDGKPTNNFGYNQTYEPYTSRELAEKIIGKPVRWYDVGTKEDLEADLVISLLSWGYHYPLETYSPKYKYLIADIRDDTCDLEQRFPNHKVIKVGDNYKRIFHANI